MGHGEPAFLRASIGIPEALLDDLVCQCAWGVVVAMAMALAPVPTPATAASRSLLLLSNELGEGALEALCFRPRRRYVHIGDAMNSSLQHRALLALAASKRANRHRHTHTQSIIVSISSDDWGRGLQTCLVSGRFVR